MGGFYSNQGHLYRKDTYAWRWFTSCCAMGLGQDRPVGPAKPESPSVDSTFLEFGRPKKPNWVPQYCSALLPLFGEGSPTKIAKAGKNLFYLEDLAKMVSSTGKKRFPPSRVGHVIKPPGRGHFQRESQEGGCFSRLPNRFPLPPSICSISPLWQDIS